MPTATQLGCDRELLGIGRLVLDGGGAARQRGIVRRRGLEALLPKLAEETSGPTAEEAEDRLLGDVPASGTDGTWGSRLGGDARPGRVLLAARRRGGRAASPSSPPRSPRARADPVTITVTARDYSFKLSAKTAPVGKVTFAVTNTGKKDHSFQIAGKKTAVLKPGKSAKLVVTFTKAGPFTYTSTVAGDAGKG